MSEIKLTMEHVERLIDQYDFEKIRKIMFALDWQWISTIKKYQNTYSVPTVERMATAVRNLGISLVEKQSKQDGVCFGGFNLNLVRIRYADFPDDMMLRLWFETGQKSVNFNNDRINCVNFPNGSFDGPEAKKLVNEVLDGSYYR